MAINKTIWTDFKNTIEGITPGVRPDKKYKHIPQGASLGELAGTRDRLFKIHFQPGAEAPINMCRTEMDVTKTYSVEIGYGVPRNKENDDWLADIQDDADEIIRALQNDVRQFDVADATGAMIRRIHNGILEVEILDFESQQAILTIGFEVTYQRS